MDNPDMKAIMNCRGISWTKGNFKLGPINQDLIRGSFTVVIGPNGAGKTSLVKILIGLEKPQRGSIYINDTPLTCFKSRQRASLLSYLSQWVIQPPPFSTEEYIKIGCFSRLNWLSRLKEKEHKRINDEIIAWGLEKLCDRPVTKLSGGEFQRARLARALVQNPRILILDEPVNHLDLPTRLKILERLSRESKNGRTILAVFHDVNDALMYADNIWLMNMGKIVDSGPPNEVLTARKLSEIYKVRLTNYHSRRKRLIGPAD